MTHIHKCPVCDGDTFYVFEKAEVPKTIFLQCETCEREFELELKKQH